MVSGPKNLKRRPTWIVRRAQDDSGKGTGILEFRPSATGTVGAGKPLDSTYVVRESQFPLTENRPEY